MKFETLLFEKGDGVATITLNRPQRHNAINWTMDRELGQAWTDVKADPQVTVVIVTGAGERAFCTGFDMDFQSRGEAAPEPRADAGHVQLHFTAIQNRCWKPVITAVNGMTTGGGLHFIADSDIVICAEDATFFDNHVRVGMVSATEPVSLVRRIPFEAVMRMALMGGAERMSAQRAHQLGMVSEVLPKERLLPRAVEIAQMLLANSPAAMMRSKKAVWGSLDHGLDKGLEYGWSVLGGQTGHPDQAEGPRAFVEKRKPRWAPPPPEV